VFRLVKFDVICAEEEETEGGVYRIRTCDTLTKGYKRYISEREKK
jgi:hypothetical protein